VSSDPVRRLMRSIDPVTGAEWIARHAQPLWRALPDPIIVDWDCDHAVEVRHLEGAEVGYNPGKPGRRSLHPLLRFRQHATVPGISFPVRGHGHGSAVAGGDGGCRTLAWGSKDLA